MFRKGGIEGRTSIAGDSFVFWAVTVDLGEGAEVEDYVYACAKVLVGAHVLYPPTWPERPFLLETGALPYLDPGSSCPVPLGSLSKGRRIGKRDLS